MHSHPFDISPLSRRIWEDKYQLRDAGGRPVDKTVDDTWQRLARAAAKVETDRDQRARSEQMFLDALSEFVFLPAGRIIAGAGSARDVTLFNCFVMGTIEDDLSSIFENVREAALTMQKGGGIGHDFSTLRPLGAPVASLGADASGPVSFMHVWDAMCQTIMSAGARRGAMMGTLRCDHPDIERFIDAKAEPGRLTNFNLSVLVPDAFIAAVDDDADWPLVFAGKVYRTVRARELWDRMMRATYDYAEPGVIFIDRINQRNNLAYCETIQATNPCGEQPLPPYGACLLGSINLARLVGRPFSQSADIDTAALEEHVRVAVRFLDNIIDISNYPLSPQEREAKAKRRIGLGVTGLGDALIFCGLHYGSQAARERAARWMSLIQNAAYLASSELAAKRGAFPLCDMDALQASPNVQALDGEVRAAIAASGLRNGCLTSIAPTGTISLLAGNVSSGIEPLFAIDYSRRILQPDGSVHDETVADYATALYRQANPDGELPDTFVTAGELSVEAHLGMQAAMQVHVDSSISKTINCPPEMTFEAFKDTYRKAYDLGLKGCTTFRPNAVTGAVLTEAASADEMPGQAGSATRDGKELLVQENVLAPAGGSDIAVLSQPMERDVALAGVTYKLKWPGSAHAMYVTINDTEQNGVRRPFEIFINTKNLDHQAWTVALTRMISAVFRRGGDVTFVVEELKAIFDPQGGQWLNGRYVPSLLAAIGDIIEQHMIKIGFLAPGQIPARAPGWTGGPMSSAPAQGEVAGAALGRLCPRCGLGHLRAQEGCWICPSCGYSQC